MVLPVLFITEACSKVNSNTATIVAVDFEYLFWFLSMLYSFIMQN